MLADTAPILDINEANKSLETNPTQPALLS